MNIRKAIYFLVVLAFFTTASIASAAEVNTRYLVKNHSQFWKKSFGVRHEFNAGFTADLNEWQLKLAKVFGVEVEPVKRLNILPAVTKRPKALNRVPTEQVSWGVRMMYGGLDPLVPDGGSDVQVAVLDTGVAKNHPDLKNRIKACRDFTNPGDAVMEGKCDDKNGHGTHIAGIIAADGGLEGKGIYGMAPESNILAYKVCMNNGTCYSDDVAAAIKSAADHNAQVINLSLGSDADNPLLEEAISYAFQKEVLVIAAAGNDGPYDGSIDYPAALSSVISVGALDVNGDIPDWSSRGENESSTPYVRDDKDIDFAGPGVNIESTGKDGDYVVFSGTSMATPHIAGLAAKLWQRDAEHPGQATKEILTQFAKDIFPLGDDNGSGWGIPTL